MKIRKVFVNNKKRAFEVEIDGKLLVFPFACLRLKPETNNRIVDAKIDPELGNEAFTYMLQTGRSDTVHADQVLEYNKDPRYLRDILVYKLTLEAQKRVEASGLAHREIIRRLGTSASQYYRLLDQTNYKKSVDQMLSLLSVLSCNVDIVVKQDKSHKRQCRTVDGSRVRKNHLIHA
jgi:hypothetical protein